MERLKTQRTSGISGNTLRTWGMVLLTLGTIAHSLLENKLLGQGTVTGEELLAMLQASPIHMTLVSIALLLKAVSTCAVPIFALMLIEGFENTGDRKNYFVRVLVLALITEIPYDLAMSGRFLEMRYQNPVLGMAVGLVLLYFFDQYEENSFPNVLIKVVVTVAALAWGWMLHIDDCTCLILVLIVLWAFREKTRYRNFAGGAVALLCSIFSPFYLAAPMGFLVIHFYNGDRNEVSNRVLYYGAYPMMLLLVGLAVKFVL